MKKEKRQYDTISDRIIDRLPKYYKLLEDYKAAGNTKISSKIISELLGVTASLVRLDFAHFGAFGTKGYGYDVDHLIDEMRAILNLDRSFNVIIVGAGKIGRALALYKDFKKDGFTVTALFDVNVPASDSENLNILNVDTIETYLKKNKTDVAVITVQKSNAKTLAKKIYDAGVKNFWNFAPTELNLPADAVVENIDMSESLFKLAYRIKSK